MLWKPTEQTNLPSPYKRKLEGGRHMIERSLTASAPKYRHMVLESIGFAAGGMRQRGERVYSHKSCQIEEEGPGKALQYQLRHPKGKNKKRSHKNEQGRQTCRQVEAQQREVENVLPEVERPGGARRQRRHCPLAGLGQQSSPGGGGQGLPCLPVFFICLIIWRCCKDHFDIVLHKLMSIATSALWKARVCPAPQSMRPQRQV